MMQAEPSRLMPMNEWEERDETMALTAIWTSPSVAFLKPTGIERPEAISRWVWLSVVRAPIEAQLTSSAVYCGTMGSSISEPAGRPSSLTRISNSRAIRRPRLMSAVPSRPGSTMSPRQPTVVRGFSK